MWLLEQKRIMEYCAYDYNRGLTGIIFRDICINIIRVHNL